MTASRVRRWFRVIWKVLVAASTLALAGALVMALMGLDWSVVRVVFAQRDGGQIGLLLAGALLTSTLGLALGFLAWRVVLLELGPPVSTARAVRVFTVSFLAKYVPGRVPGLIAATKVAKANEVSFGRLMGTAALSLSLVMLTGLTIGLLAGIQVLGAQTAWLVAAAVLIVIALARPRLVNRGAHLLLRLVRRREPAGSASARGVRLAVAAQSLSWLVAGLHLWLLAIAMGAAPARSLALCVGAFTLAMTLGQVAVVIPDGIGVREAVLTAALTIVLPTPAAAVVALASRVVFTVSEVALGVAALTVAEVLVRRTPVAEPQVCAAEPARRPTSTETPFNHEGSH
jgi:uncharacterized membrane protein YbhN (UPF0104 family)